MEIKSTETIPEFLNKQMEDELYVTYARREAQRLIKKIDNYKVSAILEKHLNANIDKYIVGS